MSGILPVSSEPRAHSFPGLSNLFIPVARRRTRCQRLDESMGSRGHFVDRAVEHNLVRPRGTIRTAQLPDELQSRSADLVLCRRRLKIGQGFDVSAHAYSPSRRLYTAPEIPATVDSPRGA